MKIQEKYIIKAIREGRLLSPSQIAEKYNITDRNVRDQADKGAFTDEEAVRIKGGWFITLTAVERVWGHKKRE